MGRRPNPSATNKKREHPNIKNVYIRRYNEVITFNKKPTKITRLSELQVAACDSTSLAMNGLVGGVRILSSQFVEHQLLFELLGKVVRLRRLQIIHSTLEIDNSIYNWYIRRFVVTPRSPNLLHHLNRLTTADRT
jgi:hypothetical protein